MYFSQACAVVFALTAFAVTAQDADSMTTQVTPDACSEARMRFSRHAQQCSANHDAIKKQVEEVTKQCRYLTVTNFASFFKDAAKFRKIDKHCQNLLKHQHQSLVKVTGECKDLLKNSIVHLAEACQVADKCDACPAPKAGNSTFSAVESTGTDCDALKMNVKDNFDAYLTHVNDLLQEQSEKAKTIVTEISSSTEKSEFAICKLKAESCMFGAELDAADGDYEADRKTFAKVSETAIKAYEDKCAKPDMNNLTPEKADPCQKARMHLGKEVEQCFKMHEQTRLQIKEVTKQCRTITVVHFKAYFSSSAYFKHFATWCENLLKHQRRSLNYVNRNCKNHIKNSLTHVAQVCKKTKECDKCTSPGEGKVTYSPMAAADNSCPALKANVKDNFDGFLKHINVMLTDGAKGARKIVDQIKDKLSKPGFDLCEVKKETCDAHNVWTQISMYYEADGKAFKKLVDTALKAYDDCQ